MPETTTTAPPATATPDTTPNAAPVQSIDSVYSDFDAIESASKPDAPKKEAGPAPKSGSAPNAEPSAPKETQSSGTETTPPTSAASDDGSKPVKPVRAAELREAHDRLKKDFYALRAKHEELQKVQVSPERVKQLEELLDNERKARQAIEQELRLTAYEKSQEYKDKFQKPFIQAYNQGRTKAASLKVIEQKNDMDEIIRPSRQGTPEDFDAIARIEDDDAAAERAVDLFGAKAQLVLYYRERVQELHNASRSAIEEYRTNYDTREKEQSEQRTRQETEMADRAKAQAESFRRQVEDGVRSHPELFQPVEGDGESAEVLKRGAAVADSLFSGVNPKTGRPYTPDGLVKFHAFVRNAVAAHGHILHKLKAAEAKVADLENDLKEFKASSSSADSGRGEAKVPTGLPGDEEFDEAESKSTRRW